VAESFTGFFSGIISDIKDAVETYVGSDSTFEETAIGQVQIDYLNYPCIHIIPDESNYEATNTYTNRIRVNYYFEKGQDANKYITYMEEVEKTMDDIILKLEGSDNIEYRVENVVHLAGGTENNLLEIVQVEFNVTKGKDLADIT